MDTHICQIRDTQIYRKCILELHVEQYCMWLIRPTDAIQGNSLWSVCCHGAGYHKEMTYTEVYDVSACSFCGLEIGCEYQFSLCETDHIGRKTMKVCFVSKPQGVVFIRELWGRFSRLNSLPSFVQNDTNMWPAAFFQPVTLRSRQVSLIPSGKNTDNVWERVCVILYANFSQQKKGEPMISNYTKPFPNFS